MLRPVKISSPLTSACARCVWETPWLPLMPPSSAWSKRAIGLRPKLRRSRRVAAVAVGAQAAGAAAWLRARRAEQDEHVRRALVDVRPHVARVRPDERRVAAPRIPTERSRLQRRVGPDFGIRAAADDQRNAGSCAHPRRSSIRAHPQTTNPRPSIREPGMLPLLRLAANERGCRARVLLNEILQSP
jgi:hypothetical protein